MDKYIFDESNGLWYELQGDYYIPCLILSEKETQPIGLWGQRHKQYLKEHKQFLYTTMLIEGTLNSYLADIDRQAQERLLLLTKQIAEQENVTEQLKADNAMLWVQKMNEIQSRVREIIYSESKIKKYRQWQCLHCSSRPLTVLRILLSLSVAFFNFKRCLKQLIVLKYMLIQIRV